MSWAEGGAGYALQQSHVKTHCLRGIRVSEGRPRKSLRKFTSYPVGNLSLGALAEGSTAKSSLQKFAKLASPK